MKRAFVLVCIIFFVMHTRGYAENNAVSILNNSAEGITLDVALGSFAFLDVKNTAYKKVIADGFSIIDKSGFPGVLVKGILLDIPPGCDIAVSAAFVEEDTFEKFLLQPSPQQLIDESEAGVQKLSEKLEADSKAYEADSFFPGKFAEVEYTGYLRGRRVARLLVYPVQYNPSKKVLTVYKQLRVFVTYKYHNIALAEQNLRTSPNSHQKHKNIFEKIYKSSLLNYSASASFVQAENANKNLLSENASWTSEISTSPFSFKAAIENEGMYKVTYTDLLTLGVSLSTATNENLKMANLGQEISIYCSGKGPFKSGDYLIFYGKPFKSLYSKKNIYWLYQGKQNGKRMQAVDGSPVSSYLLQTAFKSTLHAEKDLLYWSNIPPFTAGVDHWLWEKFSIIAPPLSKDFTVSLGHISKTSGDFSINTCLKGETNTGQTPDHHTKIYINDTLIDDFTWDGQSDKIQATKNISPSYFLDGDNKITVEAVADLGVTVDSYYLNWFELAYGSKYAADNNLLKFHNSDTGGIQFSIEGFSENIVWGFDVTDPVNASRIVNPRIAQSGGAYTMSFQDRVSDNRTYYAIAASAFTRSSELIADESSSLNSPRENVDYIIITHDKFYDGIQELKAYRESKGFNVEVVKIQDIYDEFSYGIKDVKAIKDFLTYAYNEWNKNDHPAYVLLVGDATTDYRDDKGNYAKGKEDLVPTYLYETNPFGNTPTDNWFVCVDGTDYLPDMIIGRISVKTVDDLQNVIRKIKNYEKADAAAWCGNVILAADNEAIFESISNTLAEMIPEGFNAEKIFISAYDTIGKATDDLINKINAGAILTNYTGHGNIDEWAAEYLFHTTDDGNSRNDVDRLNNGNKLTFLMALNCLNGFFCSQTDDYSLAEEFVRSSNKGAVACFAPTSLGYPSEHQVLSKKIFNGLFNDNNTIVGSLVTSAKIDTYNQINSRDLIETFTLFGDPATELKRISGGSIKEFKIAAPFDNETLNVMPPYTFTWGKGLYERFKVQYSTDAGFSPETTITVPLLPLAFISTDHYKPNIFIWALLNMMSSKGESLYCRIAAYDYNFNQIAFTSHNSFSINK